MQVTAALIMDVKLPNLGEGADSGTVVNLFVKEGDEVAKDQPILELENEKAVATIPSTAAGKVKQIFVKAGEKISVGQRILSLDEAGAGSAGDKGKTQSPKSKAQGQESEEPAPKPRPQSPKAKNQQPPSKGDEQEAEKEEDAEDEAGEQAERPSEAAAAVAASPSLRKMARDLGIDLTRVRGSERGGRIVLADVRAYLERLQRKGAQPKPAAESKSGVEGTRAAFPSKVEPVDFSKWGSVSKKAFSPLRQVIARRMTEIWQTIPHVTQFDEADVTGLMALRSKYVKAYEQKGARLTLTGFALKAVVETLKKHPVFNSSLDESTQELVTKEYYHIGVAVDTEAGLIVPVLRDVDKKSLLELSKEVEDLAKKARDRKVSGEELKGGTFTISNQGGIGGGHFTPIINKPEVAILGLGRGQTKPVLRDEKIEPRVMLPMALSYDHRVIDGGAAARFIVDLVKAFEGFGEDMVRF